MHTAMTISHPIIRWLYNEDEIKGEIARSKERDTYYIDNTIAVFPSLRRRSILLNGTRAFGFQKSRQSTRFFTRLVNSRCDFAINASKPMSPRFPRPELELMLELVVMVPELVLGRPDMTI